MFSKSAEKLFLCLPSQIVREIRRLEESNANFEKNLSEIRIRAGRISSLSVNGRRIFIPISVTEEEMTETLKLFCRGSIYAYTESLREGYVSFSGGYRIGVAGRAVYEDGILVGVSDVSSLCIRIPHNVCGAGDVAVKVWKKLEGKRGILIYSKPGNGKTTMLRDTAVQLSSGRDASIVSLVDTREELSGDFIGRNCAIDVLLGYPKAEGIEIATRTLSPNVIICDEIGGYEEAEAILSVQACGVPLIASSHGDSLNEVLSRGAIKILVENRIFGAYIGVKREPSGLYTYTVDYSEF